MKLLRLLGDNAMSRTIQSLVPAVVSGALAAKGLLSWEIATPIVLAALGGTVYGRNQAGGPLTDTPPAQEKKPMPEKTTTRSRLVFAAAAALLTGLPVGMALEAQPAGEVIVLDGRECEYLGRARFNERPEVFYHTALCDGKLTFELGAEPAGVNSLPTAPSD